MATSDLAGYKRPGLRPEHGGHGDCVAVAATSACGTGRTAFAGNLIPLSNPGISKVGPDRSAGSRCAGAQPGRPTWRRPPTLPASRRTTSLAEPAVQQGLHQLRHQVRLHDLAEEPPERPLQPPEDQHLPGSDRSALSWADRLAAEALRPRALRRLTARASTSTTSSRQAVSPRRVWALRICATRLSRRTTAATMPIRWAFPGNGPNGTDATHQQRTGGVSGLELRRQRENGNFSTPLIGYSQSLPWLRAESNIDFANNWTSIWATTR